MTFSTVSGAMLDNTFDFTFFDTSVAFLTSPSVDEVTVAFEELFEVPSATVFLADDFDAVLPVVDFLEEDFFDADAVLSDFTAVFFPESGLSVSTAVDDTVSASGLATLFSILSLPIGIFYYLLCQFHIFQSRTAVFSVSHYGLAYILRPFYRAVYSDY